MNLAESKKLLAKAIKSLPQSGSLSEVRGKMKSALSQLEKIEEKKAKKESEKTQNSFQRWEYNLSQGRLIYTSPYHSQNSIKVIEQMIQDEQEKLNGVQKVKNDNVATILG